MILFVFNSLHILCTGLFAPSHMTYEADRLPSSVEPTLTEMTAKAIQILKKNPKGYFLLIEGW